MPSADTDIILEGQSYAHWASEKTLAECCKKLDKMGLAPPELKAVEGLLKKMAAGEKVDSGTLKKTLENLKGLKEGS